MTDWKILLLLPIASVLPWIFLYEFGSLYLVKTLDDMKIWDAVMSDPKVIMIFLSIGCILVYWFT